MAPNHYDIVILGDSLAARVAGTLLARSGSRVLTVRESAGTPLCWYLSSRHLDRLLTALNGESCITSPRPFQVLTDRTRLEFHGATPLEEELRREFPGDHQEVWTLLEHLEFLGERLEQAMLVSGPFLLRGIRGKLRLFLNNLRPGRRSGRLSRPLSELLEARLGGESKATLEALFSGVSLVPLDRLSVGEGALLWHFLSRNRAVSPAAFTALLDQRYSQFHGETADWNTLRALHLSKDRSPLLTLENGEEISSGQLLIGDPELCRRVEDFPVPLPCPAARRLVPSDLNRPLSPMLSGKMILAGSPPLRFLLRRGNGRLHGAVDFCQVAGGFDSLSVRNRLKRILPFDDFTLLPADPPAETSGNDPGRRRGLLGTAGKIGLRKNCAVYLCQGSTVIPALGTTGEIMVGMQLAQYLEET